MMDKEQGGKEGPAGLAFGSTHSPFGMRKLAALHRLALRR